MSERRVSENQKHYLEEYEKFKHIEVLVGFYCLSNNPRFLCRVLSINGENAEVESTNSGLTRTRTLHWCRKNLTQISEEKFNIQLETLRKAKD